VETLESALNSMADSLSRNLDQNNRAALDTAGRIADRVLQQSLDTLTAVDPRRLFAAAGSIIRNTSEAGSGSTTDNAEEDQPQLAVNALAEH